MKKGDNFLKNLFITIPLAIVIFVISYFNGFTKLDYRSYDSLLQLKKELPKIENILVVEIDDESINSLGEWPWSRDVIADAILRLKEFDANFAVFDIEYISPSKAGVSPSAEEKISTSITQTQTEVSDVINQLTAAIYNGFYSKNEIPSLTDDMLNGIVNPAFEDLNSYISANIYRDNDEYFAQALQFFGNSYLTINNLDLGYEISKDEIEYLENRFFRENITDKDSRIKVDNEFSIKDNYQGLGKGFQPALNKLVVRTKGLGFTNSVVDGDGTRRRFELLYEKDGKYYPQLILSPLLDLLDVDSITRTSHSLILNGAKLPGNGAKENLKIPLDDHGRVLINWRHGPISESFNSVSIIDLINLDLAEASIVACLTNIYGQPVIDKNGFEMAYTQEARNLLGLYEEIKQTKELLLSKCTGYDITGLPYDGVSKDEYDSYYGLRKEFYTQLKTFLNSNYLPGIIDRLNELRDFADGEVLDLISAYFEEDFAGLSEEYKIYDNLCKKLSPVVKGAYCILGNTATSTTDIGATPFRKHYENVGLHANLMNTILNKDFIYQYSWMWGFLACFLLALLSLTLVGKPQSMQNIIGGAFLLITITVFCVLFVAFDIYIPFIGTVVFVLLNYIFGVILRFVISNKEKRLITAIASSFANKETVDQLRKNPELFDTKGHKKCITALFSDVQKFSTLSENISKQYGEDGPNKLIEILNEYLGSMSNEILYNHGTIDKYEGDAIISMFGAPDSLNTHTKEEWAYLCLDSAIRMKKAEVLFNESHPELFEPKEIINVDGQKEIVQLSPLQTRIGINTGDAYVGLMGSKTENFSKLNYTMMGDTVNLASRLEGVNKAYKSWIMCSEDTWNMANSGVNKDKIVARKLDRVRVVGKNLPVQLYNVIGFRDELNDLQINQLSKFNEAMNFYNSGNFKKAGPLFLEADKILSDETSILYAVRCKEFIEKGTPENWDGVVVMTSK